LPWLFPHISHKSVTRRPFQLDHISQRQRKRRIVGTCVQAVVARKGKNHIPCACPEMLRETNAPTSPPFYTIPNPAPFSFYIDRPRTHPPKPVANRSDIIGPMKMPRSLSKRQKTALLDSAPKTTKEIREEIYRCSKTEEPQFGSYAGGASVCSSHKAGFRCFSS
jgi:hypothetical protein